MIKKPETIIDAKIKANNDDANLAIGKSVTKALGFVAGNTIVASLSAVMTLYRAYWVELLYRHYILSQFAQLPAISILQFVFIIFFINLLRARVPSQEKPKYGHFLYWVIVFPPLTYLICLAAEWFYSWL